MFVVFDFDGVIIDSFAAIRAAVENVYAFLGFDSPSDSQVMAWSGPSVEQSSYRMQSDHALDESARRSIAAIYFDSLVDVSPKMVLPFPGIVEVLDELNAASIPIALATMKTHAEMNAMDTPLPSLERFEYLFAPESPSNEITKTDLVREATSTLQEKCGAGGQGFMVGDRFSDMEAGRECGLSTIAVTWGAGSRDELLEAVPDIFVSTPQELRKVLLGKAPSWCK